MPETVENLKKPLMKLRFVDEDGQVYSQWVEKTLGEVAAWENGYAFKPADLSDRGTPVVKIKEMLNQKVLDVKTEIDSVPPENHIESGDIIFSWSMTIDAIRWRGGKAFLNQHLFKVTPCERISDGYLLQSLGANIKDIANLAHGGTAKHITKPTLMKFPIPLPSLPEQEKIASFFAKLDERIEAEEELLESTKELKSAYLQKLLV